MLKNRWVNTLVVAVIILAQFSLPITVFADNTTPPPVTEETVLPPTPEVIATEEPTLPPVQETVTDEPVSLPELIDQFPEDTTVIVLDQDGLPEPLVTQNAANTLVVADPIWCPIGVTPQDGLGGCSPSYTTFTELLAWLAGTNQPNQGGTIWLEAGYDSAGEGVTGFTLDGNSYTNFDNHALTIQGGWNGLGTTTINQNDPSTFTGDFLHISNWNANVTINDIIINGATTGDGLSVETSGNINLENIEANNNIVGVGAKLNNSSGTGNVTLTGTNVFSNNYYDGLAVRTNGNIMLNNVTANGNIDTSGIYPSDGAFLVALGTGNVTLTGTNVFNNNSAMGLRVFSSGDITLNNITASGNINGDGAHLDNTLGNGDVILTGINVFNNNHLDGLSVYSGGSIMINNLTASGNILGRGAYLDPYMEGGNVTLTGANEFDNNGDNGLYVNVAFHHNSDVNINSITASGNGVRGVFIVGWGEGSSGDVTLTGTNVFTNNSEQGLTVFSNGGITLNNIIAIGNLHGVAIQQYHLTKPVILTGTLNAFYNNNGDSLIVWAYGPIVLSNISAIGNTNGVYLDNTGGAVKRDVTLLGTNVFNNSNNAGLIVYSNGNIYLNNVSAIGNGWSGVVLSTARNVIINSGVIENNGWYGVNTYDVCGDSALNGVVFKDNYVGDILESSGGFHVTHDVIDGPDILIPCKGNLFIDGVLINGTAPILTLLSTTGRLIEFALSCTSQNVFFVTLPNDDQIQIFCPVSGSARIARLDNTMLPGDLPAGYNYLSAFSLDILQDSQPISVIVEGGHIKASFKAPALQTGSIYSILYWNNGAWIPLKDFMVDENGSPHVFDLAPGVPDDTRKVISGVEFVAGGDSSRIEVSTNFPGIFVLVQH